MMPVTTAVASPMSFVVIPDLAPTGNLPVPARKETTNLELYRLPDVPRWRLRDQAAMLFSRGVSLGCGALGLISLGAGMANALDIYATGAGTGALVVGIFLSGFAMAGWEIAGVGNARFDTTQLNDKAEALARELPPPRPGATAAEHAVFAWRATRLMARAENFTLSAITEHYKRVVKSVHEHVDRELLAAIDPVMALVFDASGHDRWPNCDIDRLTMALRQLEPSLRARLTSVLRPHLDIVANLADDGSWRRQALDAAIAGKPFSYAALVPAETKELVAGQRGYKHVTEAQRTLDESVDAPQEDERLAEALVSYQVDDAHVLLLAATYERRGYYVAVHQEDLGHLVTLYKGVPTPVSKPVIE